AANRVRVMAQLIDARTDAHLWAQTYDRDLADVFAIQSEIAKTIADQLQARLSPAEKPAIEQRPTADLAAFDLYVRPIAFIHRTLPNNPRIFELSGYIDRRQGRWEESTRDFERSLDLDPRNVVTLRSIAHTYICLREYAKAGAALDRVVALKPDDSDIRLLRATVDMDWKADTRPWHALVETMLKDNPGSAESIAPNWLYLATCERDSVAAARALAVFGNKTVVAA